MRIDLGKRAPWLAFMFTRIQIVAGAKSRKTIYRLQHSASHPSGSLRRWGCQHFRKQPVQWRRMAGAICEYLFDINASNRYYASMSNFLQEEAGSYHAMSFSNNLYTSTPTVTLGAVPMAAQSRVGPTLTRAVRFSPGAALRHCFAMQPAVTSGRAHDRGCWRPSDRRSSNRPTGCAPLHQAGQAIRREAAGH